MSFNRTTKQAEKLDQIQNILLYMFYKKVKFNVFFARKNCKYFGI